MFEDLLSQYEALEPAGADKWNPLRNDLELWHRTRLLVELARTLKALPGPLEETRVLDVGCGIGRSTRSLLEFGLKPENLMGIDLRATAIEQARRLNPAIPFRTVNGFDDWPLQSEFDLCLQCTVFSSIPGIERRQATARMMRKAVGSEGFIFWWDRLTANDFAGNDPLDPAAFFADRRLLSLRRVSLWPGVEESLRPLRGLRKFVAPVFARLGYPRTHVAAVFGPRV
jgi:SAM-dependent methyltransferase